ncbi:hypothetical protein L249_5691 [Ophiocordyceps polyrhachis-furcata BCC 54312]|uniref:Uncharacterized protein n=1 Tax=Ophiocordyceps polyrhachis-furcata BCC 54312 TaxID=1330021 RepID=A0A367KZY8_9HYPO|nr:hypothetical protein L249_5691 [Ophiocordyceps polyrhachis-furcata BCC 54312]
MFRRAIFARSRPRPPSRTTHLSVPSSSRSSSSSSRRIDKLTSKLPARFQKYAVRLRNAPFSHVVAFLVLHEITAVVPLVALWALFHYTTLVPLEFVAGRFAAYTDAGVAKFERYFRRKRWFGFDGEQPGQPHGPDQEHTHQVMQRRESGDRSYKILVEVALAYAVTKALLPLRIVASLLAAPWFARVMTSIGSSLFRKQ